MHGDRHGVPRDGRKVEARFAEQELEVLALERVDISLFLGEAQGVTVCPAIEDMIVLIRQLVEEGLTI